MKTEKETYKILRQNVSDIQQANDILRVKVNNLEYQIKHRKLLKQIRRIRRYDAVMSVVCFWRKKRKQD